MRAKLTILLTIAILFFQDSQGYAQHDWTEKIAALKPTVVNIERSSEIVFETEKQGKSYGTGFIIDADKGIIATNAHVTGISPSNVSINFYNGSITQAKKLYFDPVHDFGFYQLDPQKLEFKLQFVECGSWNDLSMGDELLFIGNNEREEYSVKFGTVANININMSFAADGSSFSQLGYRDKKNRLFGVIITEFDGRSIKNIDDFINVCADIKDGQNTFVIVRDFMQFNTSLKPKSLTVNLKYGPLELFSWTAESLDWQKIEALPLKKKIVDTDATLKS
jgi:S1-C subfamily serine protease